MSWCHQQLLLLQESESQKKTPILTDEVPPVQLQFGCRVLLCSRTQTPSVSAQTHSWGKDLWSTSWQRDRRLLTCACLWGHSVVHHIWNLRLNLICERYFYFVRRFYLVILNAVNTDEIKDEEQFTARLAERLILCWCLAQGHSNRRINPGHEESHRDAEVRMRPFARACDINVGVMYEHVLSFTSPCTNMCGQLSQILNTCTDLIHFFTVNWFLQTFFKPLPPKYLLKIKKLCKLIKRQMDALDIHTVYTCSSSGHKRAAVKEK